MKATMFTGWIYDFLKPYSLGLKVAHPEMLKAITSVKKKNDRLDAEKIYDLPISTDPLEGINNKIKTMKRQVYSLRDLEFFKLKIMAIYDTKYALAG